jgi:hypothetical protein
MSYAMLTGFEMQERPLGASIPLCGLVLGKILHPKPLPSLLVLLVRFVPLLIRKPCIPLPTVAVWNVGVQLFLLTGFEIPITKIVAVGQPRRVGDAMLATPQRLDRGLGSRHDPAQMLGILAIPTHLRHDHDVMLVVDQRLRILSLNDPMRGRHFGGLMIGKLALDRLALSAHLLALGRQPGLDALGMPTSAFHPRRLLLFLAVLGRPVIGMVLLFPALAVWLLA